MPGDFLYIVALLGRCWDPSSQGKAGLASGVGVGDRGGGRGLLHTHPGATPARLRALCPTRACGLTLPRPLSKYQCGMPQTTLNALEVFSPAWTPGHPVGRASQPSNLEASSRWQALPPAPCPATGGSVPLALHEPCALEQATLERLCLGAT